ncbi:Tn7-like element transposition protein TnsE [Shewanella mangrovisoli]|uniref:Tn7-like element transposition protein TnsE n=1 Tax=Shewanella mangrovisoli TaxID=2864211 RepID=A0ABV4VP74_9GAMM
MNGTTHLKGFKDDTWINGIGDLFRKKDSKQWGINLSIYPSKDNCPDAIILSNAPILIRKHIINPTKDYYRKDFEKTIKISTTSNWQVDKLENCPALERRLPKELGQYCFVFQLTDRSRVYLPQFELARALFFHNAYLARSSVVHDLLSNEFSLEQDGDKAIINVLETFSGNWELFNDYGYRRLIAWLLMDKDARSSYGSIGNYQLNDGYDVGQYRRWAFRFDPPALKGAKLKLKGHFDLKTNTLFVYEISSILNIPTDLPEHIEFFSPKFYSQVNGQGRAARTGADRPPNHDIDETAEGSRDNKPVMISENTTEFEFDRAVQTSKVSKKRKSVGRGKKDAEEPSEASSDVSTEEQGPNGDLPSAEWDNLNEQTDDAHLYLNKFYSYFRMLDLLEEKHGCRVIKYPLRKLPAVGKCKRHILETDGNPRCLSVTHITVETTSYYLLEVDTSDSSKALSTKVIRASAIGDIQTHLHEIEKQLLKASLSWPKEHLNALVGNENHFWVPHQKSGKGGALNEKEVMKWSDRFFESLT